jgi:arylsulfatase A-like enzyme
MELIDVAPSALAVLDIEPPGTMDGRAAFARR